MSTAIDCAWERYLDARSNIASTGVALARLKNPDVRVYLMGLLEVEVLALDRASAELDAEHAHQPLPQDIAALIADGGPALEQEAA